MTKRTPPPKPVQIHALLGRVMYLFLLLGCLNGICTIVALVAHLCLGTPVPAPPWVMLLNAIPTLGLAEWARRYGGSMWATSAGLALGFPKRVIPWSDVLYVRYMPTLSNMLPCYVIKFRNSVVPLYFFGREDPERVVARFQAAASV